MKLLISFTLFVLSVVSYRLSSLNRPVYSRLNSAIGSTHNTDLVPHAAPTDTPESLKNMVDRALVGMSKIKRISLLG